MNILFLTTHFNTGGITSYILTLGEALVKSGHKVWVASSGGKDVDRVWRQQGYGMSGSIYGQNQKFHPKLWLSFGPLKSSDSKRRD